jgi:hypothetical protein
MSNHVKNICIMGVKESHTNMPQCSGFQSRWKKISMSQLTIIQMKRLPYLMSFRN